MSGRSVELTEERGSYLSKLAPSWLYEQGKNRELQYSGYSALVMPTLSQVQSHMPGSPERATKRGPVMFFALHV